MPGTFTTGLLHILYPYTGEKQYLTGMLAYIQQARAVGGTVLMATLEERRALLSTHLAEDPAVAFVDTAELGRNPGRLIQAWQHWIARLVRRGAVYGISESLFPAHTRAARGELRYQEWLLNRAFARTPPGRCCARWTPLVRIRTPSRHWHSATP